LIDLHIHSDLSDGTNSIDSLVSLASQQAIRELALTDHDTIRGLPEMTRSAKDQGINVIPGIELTSKYHEHILHILGYMIDPENSQLTGFLEIANQHTTQFTLDLITQLNQQGLVNYPSSKVEPFLNTKDSLYPSDLIKAMIQDGHPYHLEDWPAFYMATFHHLSSSFQFPLSAVDAIQVILAAGGVPVIAHPAKIGKDHLAIIEKLVPSGLLGIEVFYPYHDQKLIDAYLSLTNRYQLLATGGTDWHGQFTTWNAVMGQYGVQSTQPLYSVAKSL